MRDRTKEAAKKTVLRAADQIRVEVDTEIGTILLADHARAMEHAGFDEEAVALFDVEIVMIDLKQHGAAQNIDHFNLRMPVALQGSGGIAGENDALKDEWKLAASVGTQLKHFFVGQDCSVHCAALRCRCGKNSRHDFSCIIAYCGAVHNVEMTEASVDKGTHACVLERPARHSPCGPICVVSRL